MKLYGIVELAKIFNVSTTRIIGIYDTKEKAGQKIVEIYKKYLYSDRFDKECAELFPNTLNLKEIQYVKYEEPCYYFKYSVCEINAENIKGISITND